MLGGLFKRFDDSLIPRFEPTYPTYVGTTRTVGTSGTYSTITAAWNASSNGDIVEVLNDLDMSLEPSGYLLLNIAKSVKIKGTNSSIRIYSNTTQVLRARIIRSVTFEDLIIDSSGGKTIIYDAGVYTTPAELFFTNCTILNSSSVNLMDIGLATYNIKMIFTDCIIENSNVGILMTLNGKLDDIYYFKGCTITQNANNYNVIGEATENYKVYFYDSNLYSYADYPVLRIGKDTSVPITNGVFADIRENNITYLGGAVGHGMLIGRGTDDVKILNNKVTLLEDTDTSNIGIVIKTINTTTGGLVKGNTCIGYRPMLVKGGSNLDIQYNYCKINIDNYAGFEITNIAENVDLNSNTITFKNNKVFGGSESLLFSSSTAEPISTTKTTWDFDNNIYSSVDGDYITSQGVSHTFENRTDYWTDDANSVFI